ncbi:hypothetical protein K6119_00465 [Paracrocinitomix mangrovi]|uniref:hypothetical protein n=1 Tax=Paracrocinitomix mangrovi TaxID=2862509 RepID=UPI001C8DCA40|nr:hypothetical protein [Paracrocinitomix mangrovi]UKN01987.1 hypothetical protein K6119_00465 [Paracrocinitomix mangrovi]
MRNLFILLSISILSACNSNGNSNEGNATRGTLDTLELGMNLNMSKFELYSHLDSMVRQERAYFLNGGYAFDFDFGPTARINPDYRSDTLFQLSYRIIPQYEWESAKDVSLKFESIYKKQYGRPDEVNNESDGEVYSRWDFENVQLEVVHTPHHCFVNYNLK